MFAITLASLAWGISALILLVASYFWNKIIVHIAGSRLRGNLFALAVVVLGAMVLNLVFDSSLFAIALASLTVVGIFTILFVGGKDRWREMIVLLAQSRLRGNLVALIIGVVGASLFYFIFNTANLPRITASLFVPNPLQNRPHFPLGEDPRNADSLKIVQEALKSSDSNAWEDESVLLDAKFASEKYGAPSTSRERDVLWVSRYRVYKNAKITMVVEIRVERQGDNTAVVADLGWYAPTSETYYRIPWWQTNDLASANHFALISHDGVLPRVSYPASPRSLVSWIKSHWVKSIRDLEKSLEGDEARVTLTNDEIRQKIAPELERLLNTVYGQLGASSGIVMSRILNDWIQFLMLALFLSALAIIASRTMLYHWDSDSYRAHLELPQGVSTKELMNRVGEKVAELQALQAEHSKTYHFESPVLRIWQGALSALRRQGDYGDVPEFLRAFADAEKDQSYTSLNFVRFLVGSMPALGFIGTVIGIPSALLLTGNVLSDELAKQQSGVSQVVVALAYAFDTTLVGLLFALFGSYGLSRLGNAEERRVDDTCRHCMDEFIQKVDPQRQGRHYTVEVDLRQPDTLHTYLVVLCVNRTTQQEVAFVAIALDSPENLSVKGKSEPAGWISKHGTGQGTQIGAPNWKHLIADTNSYSAKIKVSKTQHYVPITTRVRHAAADIDANAFTEEMCIDFFKDVCKTLDLPVQLAEYRGSPIDYLEGVIESINSRGTGR